METPQPEKLFTCVMKCAHCLKEIGRQKHMTRDQRLSSPIRTGYKPCSEHPNYGFVIELTPE
jgi:hypothetical protein